MRHMCPRLHNYLQKYSAQLADETDYNLKTLKDVTSRGLCGRLVSVVWYQNA